MGYYPSTMRTIPAMIRLVCAFLCSVLTLAAFGGEVDPGAPGPWSTRTLVTSVPFGRTPIRLVTVLPESEGPWPLIVFSHGFTLRGDLYRSYADRLASHGFVVGLPTYPGLATDHRALADGLHALLSYYTAAAGAAGSPLKGRILTEKIGLAGHSLGGKISLLVASEDSRVRAVAGLDPVDGAGPGMSASERYPSVIPDRIAELTVPLLLLGADRAREPRFGLPCAPEDRNYERIFEAGSGPALEITQLEAGHTQYLDDPGCGIACFACVTGERPSREIRADAQGYLTAFFLAWLSHLETARDWLERRLEEDLARGFVRLRQR